jgi:hypothetical protein
VNRKGFVVIWRGQDVVMARSRSKGLANPADICGTIFPTKASAQRAVKRAIAKWHDTPTTYRIAAVSPYARQT